MIIEVSLKENLKNKKIIKITNIITQDELLKLLSNKFGKKIISVGTMNEFEFNVQNNLPKNIDMSDQHIKLICSPNVIKFNKQESINCPLITKHNIPIKIFAHNSYIPTEAQTQLENLSTLEGIKYLIGMPDLHQGKYPVGSVVITDNVHIYPELIGPDIGCGMSLIKTSISITKYNIKQLKKIADKINIGKFVFDSNYTEQHHQNIFYSNNISIKLTNQKSNEPNKLNSPSIDSNWIEQYCLIKNIIIEKTMKEKISEKIEYLSKKYLSSMGTIGLGNHFVELLQLDKIKMEELFNKYQLEHDYYTILVHSGSRGLGEEILQQYQSSEINIDEYKILHDYAIDWAKHNRYAIAYQFANYIGTELEYLVDLTHNWVETKEVNSEFYNIHRKGAAPAYDFPIIIPGSRGTRTWFVEPNQQIQNLETGFSVSHGAGRKISRTKALDSMKNKSIRDKEICCNGDSDISNIVICQDINLFYEEAPFAYKDIQSVIDDLEYFKLAIPICSFIPIITFKCKK